MKISFMNPLSNLPDTPRPDSVNHLKSVAWPSRQLEDWKYTNINHLKNENFQLLPAPNKEICLEFLNQFRRLSHRQYLYIFDGFFVEGASDKFLDPTEVECYQPENPQYEECLADFFDTSEKNVLGEDVLGEDVLGKNALEKNTSGKNIFEEDLARENVTGETITSETITSEDKHKKHVTEKKLIEKASNFVRSLNSVYAKCPVLLRIQRSLEKKLSIVFLSTKDDSTPYMSVPSLKLLLQKSCEAVVEVSYITQKHHLHVGKLDIKVLRDSHLKLLTLVEPDQSSTCMVSNEISIDTESRLDVSNLIRGSRLTRFTQHIKADGELCSINVGCAYLAEEKEQVQIISKVDHNFPNGQSSQVIKGILDGQSRATINGRIYIAPDAQKVESAYSNHNLMLSEQAEVNTKPELEVEADDVKAAHGATVGKIDEEVLFYLASRGISESTARRLFLKGFLHEALGVLNGESVLTENIEEYFGNIY